MDVRVYYGVCGKSGARGKVRKKCRDVTLICGPLSLMCCSTSASATRKHRATTASMHKFPCPRFPKGYTL